MSCPSFATITDGSPAGLTAAEAQRRLREFGPNATPEEPARPLRLFASKFLAPVPCLLEAAIVLQLVLGEYVEASIIAVLLVFNAALGFLHESRAQATIAALKSRLALNASVRRDGEWKTIPAAELVAGDLIKLSLGSVVAADARLVQGFVLLDQSMLTGELLPIEAEAGHETYAGALVRRGEALARVTATGSRTKFGRTAELVRTAHATSSQQKAIFRIVRNLAVFNGAVCTLMIGYAFLIGMPIREMLPLVLVAILASIPIALPANFILATAIGAQALAKRGVLSTRLSAVDEAGTMDVLCSDKTGTLTQNELAVTEVRPRPGYDAGSVLALAALASSDGGPDLVDAAVRAAAPAKEASGAPLRIKFVPFDPALKMSEASVADGKGGVTRVVKGAFAAVAKLVEPSPKTTAAATELEARGFRVLAVAVGSPAPSTIVGLIALSDPPRVDAKPLIEELRRLGVQVVMVTGDAAATASVVADAVGQGRRNRREHSRLIGILLADRRGGGKRGAIAGQRLGNAFVVLADDGALSGELRVALVSARQRRFHGFRGNLARRGRNHHEDSGCRRRNRRLNPKCQRRTSPLSGPRNKHSTRHREPHLRGENLNVRVPALQGWEALYAP